MNRRRTPSTIQRPRSSRAGARTVVVASLALLVAAGSPVSSRSGNPTPTGDERGAAWPAWRGPGGMGIAESSLPAEIDPASPLWSVTPPGTSTSTPIVAGGRVFLTSQLGTAPLARPEPGEDGSGDRQLTFLTLAYDLATGKELWRREIPSQGELTPVHSKHNLASPSPASDGERVIAWFGTGQIASYRLDGEVEWQRHLGAEISPFELRWAHGSSPVILGDRVILLCDHAPAAYLLALDKRTGRQLWKAERGTEKRAYSTPLVIPDGRGVEIPEDNGTATNKEKG